MHIARHPAALAAALFLAACGASSSGAPPDEGGSDEPPTPAATPSVPPTGVALPWSYAPFPAVKHPSNQPPARAELELGRLLFYDPITSADGETACGTCHSEFWGLGDGLPRAIGTGAGLLSGPGRSGPSVGRRNATTLWNVAYRESAFWDGRAASLEDQVHFPFEAELEFARAFADVIAEVRAIPGYVERFAAAFPDEAAPVTEDTFARAVASFERTFVSNNAPYDAYVTDDPRALGETQERGMFLFAELGCDGCHVPPLFSSERFEDRSVKGPEGVDDAGRFEVTGDEADRGRFKVPTLRNLHDSGPYFHDGSARTVEGAVRHEVELAAANEGARTLTDAELTELTEFVERALFDSSLAPSRPDEVPSGLNVPIDGFDILR